MSTSVGRAQSDGVDLYWLPLGAGGHFVRWNGRLYERLAAHFDHRETSDLYHSALEVHVDGDRFVIESAPAWNSAEADRGVVCEGAVGFPCLGRSRLFRYEVRRWRNGVIPDVAEAVASPRRLSTNRAQAQRLLDLVSAFPPFTWGRDELGTGEMWNSNSLTAWLLSRSGHDTEAVATACGEVTDRDGHSFGDVRLAAVGRAELHREGRVEREPGDEHALGHQ